MIKNELKVFNYQSSEVRTVEVDGEPWFVLKDVCAILNIENHKDVVKRLDADEVGRFNLPHPQNPDKLIEMVCINESGLYNVLLRSDKPEAKPLRKWVTSEVLPSIRKTGSYNAVPITDYDRMVANTAAENAKIQKAQFLKELAGRYEGTTYQQILYAHATKELTGEFLLPLPQLKAKMYSAAEIGEMLGISGNKVGRLAKAHNLKTDEYGEWFKDKAKGCAKEIESFRYYETIIPVLRTMLQQTA